MNFDCYMCSTSFHHLGIYLMKNWRTGEGGLTHSPTDLFRNSILTEKTASSAALTLYPCTKLKKEVRASRTCLTLSQVSQSDLLECWDLPRDILIPGHQHHVFLRPPWILFQLLSFPSEAQSSACWVGSIFRNPHLSHLKTVAMPCGCDLRGW